MANNKSKEHRSVVPPDNYTICYHRQITQPDETQIIPNLAVKKASEDVVEGSSSIPIQPPPQQIPETVAASKTDVPIKPLRERRQPTKSSVLHHLKKKLAMAQRRLIHMNRMNETLSANNIDFVKEISNRNMTISQIDQAYHFMLQENLDLRQAMGQKSCENSKLKQVVMELDSKLTVFLTALGSISTVGVQCKKTIKDFKLNFSNDNSPNSLPFCSPADFQSSSLSCRNNLNSKFKIPLDVQFSTRKEMREISMDFRIDTGETLMPILEESGESSEKPSDVFEESEFLSSTQIRTPDPSKDMHRVPVHYQPHLEDISEVYNSDVRFPSKSSPERSRSDSFEIRDESSGRKSMLATNQTHSRITNSKQSRDKHHRRSRITSPSLSFEKTRTVQFEKDILKCDSPTVPRKGSNLFMTPNQSVVNSLDENEKENMKTQPISSSEKSKLSNGIISPSDAEICDDTQSMSLSSEITYALKEPDFVNKRRGVKPNYMPKECTVDCVRLDVSVILNGSTNNSSGFSNEDNNIEELKNKKANHDTFLETMNKRSQEIKTDEKSPPGTTAKRRRTPRRLSHGKEEPVLELNKTKEDNFSLKTASGDNFISLGEIRRRKPVSYKMDCRKKMRRDF